MRNIAYPARIEKDKAGFYLVTFRDIPHALTDGTTKKEALKEASDCLGEALATCIIDNEEIPQASKTKKGEYLIAPPAIIAAKVVLYIATKKEGLNKSTLSEKIGVTEAVGRRLLDPHHDTKLTKLDNALHAIGKQIVIGLA